MATIKDNLLKLKDLSETMTDLAYTAVFLQNKTITKHVAELYKEMERLEDETLKILFRIKESEEERLGIIELTDYIKDIATAALNISKLSASPEFVGLAKEILGETDERVITATVSPKSIVANRPLGESKVRSQTKARILCLKREENWVFKTDKETKLLPGDFLVAVGGKEAQSLFRKLISG